MSLRPKGGLAIAVFRIFQEVLSNVARHAQASRVDIRIDVDAPPQPVLYLQVSDDGIGAPDEALNDARSYGVLGMRERAAQFGGLLGIASAPGRGTTVRLVMPLEGAPLEEMRRHEPGTEAPRREARAVMTIRVLICDDHRIVREGIKQILAEASDLRVMGEAARRTGGDPAGPRASGGRQGLDVRAAGHRHAAARRARHPRGAPERVPDACRC